ncbi:39S ribosomal protein L16, mitochondrial [Taxawa tesnikishii (nom. ined.)]|nr:39S ribosomal protein L16, mitochondrial [Dothideales sp. JES 119]
MPPPRIFSAFKAPAALLQGSRPCSTIVRAIFHFTATPNNTQVYRISSPCHILITPQPPLLQHTHRTQLAPPSRRREQKDRKGRPRVPTGGSTRGTTVVWGDYGLRLLDHDRRISAAQLKNGEETIRKRLRGMKYRLYTRISANIGVYTSGNESRMGKGKGSFDYWASRVAVSKIIFEIKGELHEQIVKDAFRLAGNKLPGLYEFVKKGDPPVMGITKVGDAAAEEELKRPRRTLPLPNLENTASMRSTTPPTEG